MKCPKCDRVDSDNAEIAIHLIDSHNLGYDEAMEWLRTQEELCG